MFHSMAGRWLRILCLSLWFVFTNVVIPGHRRGVISLDRQATGCCGQTTSPANCCDAKSGSRKPVPPGSSRNCAICHLAAHFTSPPALTFLPGISYSLEVIGLIPARQPRFPALVAVYDGRAPPPM